MRAVDLFAGAGGFTTGAAAAGVDVVWAANHWQLAVDTHAANHPTSAHACQDLHQADWSTVPEHDLLLAAPCCQGHAKARGKERPQHDSSRSTAWAVVSCAEYHRPETVIVENVPEFLSWSLFPAWELAMKSLGYTLTPHIIDAADAGVPQNRVRLFLVGSRSGALELGQPTEEHRAIGDVIDWSSGSWSDLNRPGRSKATLFRAGAGRAAFGERFVMPYYGSGSGKTGRDLARPLGTVTTRDRWALVDGSRMRMLTLDEYRAAMGFPDDYDLAATSRKNGIHLLGNAVCPPVAEFLTRRVLELA